MLDELLFNDDVLIVSISPSKNMSITIVAMNRGYLMPLINRKAHKELSNCFIASKYKLAETN